MILLQPASGKCKQILGETQSCAACTIEVERTLGLVGSCIELVPPLISSSLPSRPFACFGVSALFETRPTGSNRTHVAFCAATAESSRCCLQE